MDELSFLSRDQIAAIVFHLALVWPLVRIYRRVGLAPYWAALALVPVIGLGMALAPLALKRWPLVPASATPLRRRRER